MNVLHVFGELKPSGGEAMMLSAAGKWLPQGPQTILSTGTQAGVFATPLERAGYRIQHLPFRRHPDFFRKFAALVATGDYDIVHLHTEQASVWQALAIRSLVSRKLPIVRTVHHIFEFEGSLRLRKMAGRKFMKHVLNVRFLSNSPSGRRNELVRFGMNNELAPNWYDSIHFIPPTAVERKSARNALGFTDSTFVMISLGGNWEYKNYDKIVKALALLPPELDVLYLQVGVQGEGAPLETLARGTGVSHRLRCAGVVDNSLLHLHAADVYLMPSREEGFGVAAVEAMATGLPAILSNRAALWDFAQNVPGIRYIEPEPAEIALAITELAALTSAERQTHGNEQAKNVLLHYGLEAGPVDYMEVWNDMIPIRSDHHRHPDNLTGIHTKAAS